MTKVARAKLTSKFQITIPAAIRRLLGLEAGDAVILWVEGGEVFLRAAKDGWTESTRALGAEVWKCAGGVSAVERERDSWE